MKLGDRLLIIGKSGSGKTVYAINQVRQFIRENPLVNVLVINHKNEADINKVIPPLARIPKHFRAGMRINITPKLGSKEDEEATNQLLNDVYHLGNTLVYVDEGLMLRPQNREMLALQTQGRSKHISVITLSQRPKFISLFAVTQATEIVIYNVQGRDDIKTLENVVRPKDDKLENYIDAIGEFEYIKYTDREGIRVYPPMDYPIKWKMPPLENRRKPPPLPLILMGAVGLLFVI